ncbi:restriction endonuclease subunit S [Selenomonas sp. AB3002]|uniref:restriction endonuclease subunit S n=1 Tax=Selenomonas sp. AB3002 TaxID=1392502 RepID=UPI00090719E4
MKKWREVRLGDVCEKIGSGATPRGGKEAYQETGISLIRSQNVLDFEFSEDGLVYINNAQADKLKNVCVESGDVLLNITGDSVARVCMVDDAFLPARVNQHVAIIRGKRDIISNSFILYWLQVQKPYLLMLSAGGATRKALTKQMIEDLRIPLPDLSEQNRIVKVLDDIQDKIQCNSKINKILEDQAQAIFGKIIESSHSSYCTLSDVAQLNPKRALSKGNIARCIDMSQLSKSTSFPNGWEYKPFSGGMRFCNGDTLLARITPCLENGKTAYINFLDEGEVAFGSTEYVVISSRGKYPSEFFYCLARYPEFVDYAVKNMACFKNSHLMFKNPLKEQKATPSCAA